jgi:outer membrane protein OmpA-like peptidoglycan-associated protein
VGGVAVAQPTVYSREGAKAVETASATTAASNADTAANDAMHRAESLDSVVQSLDNYKSIADVTVTFQFDKAALSRDDKEQLDTFAAHMRYAKNYILEVTGGTDSTGSAAYDHDLSERRVDAVVEYLSSKHGIPVHRFYLIGIGKDQEVASDTTGEGRKQNRRVEIHLLTDMRDQIE